MRLCGNPSIGDSDRTMGDLKSLPLWAGLVWRYLCARTNSAHRTMIRKNFHTYEQDETLTHRIDAFSLWPCACFYLVTARKQGMSGVSMETVTLLNVKVWDFLACPYCGNPTPNRAGKCCSNKGKCRVALHRWRKAQANAAQDARRPEVKIGVRSQKALRQKLGKGKGKGERAVAKPEGTKWEWQNTTGYRLVKYI